MKHCIAYILLMITIVSCKDEKLELKPRRVYHANENLISFDLTYDLTDEENEMRVTSFTEFDPKLDTIEYRKNEIYISYLTLLVGCREFHGDVELKKDSLILELPNFGESVCTEAETARVRYRIKNPKNIKYKIKKARGI